MSDGTEGHLLEPGALWPERKFPVGVRGRLSRRDRVLTKSSCGAHDRLTAATHTKCRRLGCCRSASAFRLHPDGKRLVFDAGTATYEVWKMEQR